MYRQIILEYQQLPSSGQRDLTPEMIRSIEDADRPSKKGKKAYPKKGDKEGPSSKLEKEAPSQPKKKKVKKMAKKSRSPSTSDSDYVPTGHPPIHPPSKSERESKSEDSEDESSVRGGTPPPSPTHEVPVRSNPSSPPPISIPIAIPPIPPVITSQPSSTIPIPTPIFFETTTTTTKTIDTPITSKPLSLLNQPKPTLFLSNEDDDALVTKRHIKELNEKLDKLMASSSSSQDSFSEAAVKAMTASFIKEHEASISKAISAIDSSTKFSINTRLAKLQEELAIESKIMDELALKTTQVKTKSLQLNQANKEYEYLRSKWAVVKSCVSDVHALLSNVFEAHDSVLTLSVKRHLTEKLGPVLEVLSRIEASGSVVQDKGKGHVEDGDEEEETVADALKRKQHDRESDENARAAREAEEKDRKMKEAHDLLESRKTLFPLWSLEKLVKEVNDSPSTHWLEPTWSAQKITFVKVFKPTAAGKFINIKFKVTRGSANSEHIIFLADLSNLNPHDWILLNNILLTNPQEYDPIIDHIKRMLVCYILEVAKMDQEIATVLRKKPRIKPIGKSSDINIMKMGKIDPKFNTMMFTRDKSVASTPTPAAAPVLAIGQGMGKKRKAPSKSNHKGKSQDGTSSSGTKVGSAKPNSNPKGVECHHCHRIGHWKRSCLEYLQEIKDGKIKPSYVSFYTIKSNHSSHAISWVLDTGCGFHICSDLQGLRRDGDVEHGKINLIMGNKRSSPVTKIGIWQETTFHFMLCIDKHCLVMEYMKL
uniref:CCHC-type domain-containing protein n=1 Tax=Lactuca sativa TaxID=4236 RepID=A0A9R1VN03_LACSA|nr:hypothetical protein LSAT_V11C400177580 [Lactuca sativa]